MGFLSKLFGGGKGGFLNPINHLNPKNHLNPRNHLDPAGLYLSDILANERDGVFYASIDPADTTFGGVIEVSATAPYTDRVIPVAGRYATLLTWA